MMTKNKGSYKSVYECVSILLRVSSSNKIPIDVFSIVNDMKNLKLIPYSKLAKDLNVPIKSCIEFLGSELGAYTSYKGKSIIYYNDVTDNTGLIRFTIAHELGHHFLDHKRYFDDKEKITRGLAENKYKNLEKEADIFARNLLAPICMMKSIGINPGEIDKIRKIFNISNQAAMARSSFCKYDNNKMPHVIEINEKYEKYILLHKVGTTCVKCGFSNHIEYAEFCCICGSNDLVKYTGKESEYYNNETIEKYETFNCPVCHMAFACANYCPMCGALIVGFSDTVEPSKEQKLSIQY